MPVVALVVFVIMIVALVDIITKPDGEIKFLPKFFWLIVVILMPFIGAVLWFVLGREYAEREIEAVRQRPARRQSAPPVAPATSVPFDRRTTEQQLADLEREIEEERLRAEIARRKAERGDADDVS